MPTWDEGCLLVLCLSSSVCSILELQDGVMMYELRLRCHAHARAATVDEQESVGCVLAQTETAHFFDSMS